MKVHLGKFHIHGPKGCSLPKFNGTNILFLGAELQVLQGFKVDVINIGILRRTSAPPKTGHCWLHVYSIEEMAAEPSLPSVHHE